MAFRLVSPYTDNRKLEKAQLGWILMSHWTKTPCLLTQGIYRRNLFIFFQEEKVESMTLWAAALQDGWGTNV
jgi:hypothetical protein